MREIVSTLKLPRCLIVMFTFITITFLITFAITVINKKRDGSKGFEDMNSPVTPKLLVENKEISYGSMKKPNIEQGNGLKSVTYCVIDGRMIDRDDPTFNILLLLPMK